MYGEKHVVDVDDEQREKKKVKRVKSDNNNMNKNRVWCFVGTFIENSSAKRERIAHIHPYQTDPRNKGISRAHTDAHARTIRSNQHSLISLSLFFTGRIRISQATLIGIQRERDRATSLLAPIKSLKLFVILLLRIFQLSRRINIILLFYGRFD